MTLLNSIQRKFPGRERHIQILHTLLTDKGPPSNVVLWGAQRTGKNSIMKALVEGLHQSYAWVTCCQTEGIETTLHSILTQLRSRGVVCSSIPASPSPAVFLRLLPKLCPMDGQRCYLVLEKPEKLSCLMLYELLRKLQDQCMTQLMTIFIAQSSCWMSAMQTIPPLSIQFEAYTQDQLLAIMLQLFSIEDELSTDFLKSKIGVISTLLRFTNDIFILKICLRYLLRKFHEPIEQNQLSKENVTELNRHVMQYVSLVLKYLNEGHVSDLEYTLDEADAQEQTHTCIFSNKTGLHISALPVYSKILLIAGYICSYNRPEHDRILFDPTPTTKRRKSIVPSKDSKTGVLGTFDYERILLASKSLMQQVDNSENVDPMHSSVFSCQFTTLETFSFIKRVSVDPLRDAKYVCCIDGEFARRLANSLRLNLPDYLE